ncbi:MAG: aminotransferase class I/II-fold pyridoxal phosphate-dependent enzyme [Clostridiales bacterium]|jgi:cystathionine beta-lyase|nr:aminotransferase class I/II-fold pyridoxal phosphate-dependent enzyme [Clostridiales bacterium]
MGLFNFDSDFNRRGHNSIKWDINPEDVIPMFIADMDFPSPPSIVEALQERLKFPAFPYERSMALLLNSGVSWLKRIYGLDVPLDWVIPVAGIVPALHAFIKLSNKPAITSVPNYTKLHATPERFDGTMLDSAMIASKGEDGLLGYAVDLEDLEEKSREAELFYFTNPHNPLGKVYDRSELEEIARIADKNGLVVLSDEIHCEIVYEKKHIPYFEIAGDNSISLYSAGKICNMPGLPHAFAVIPNASLRDKVRRITGSMGHPGTLDYVGAAAAFSEKTDGWKREVVEYMAGNRDFLQAELKKRLPKVELARVEGTYLQWIGFGAYITGDAKDKIRATAKVELTGSTRFGGDGSYVRLNFACPRFRLADAIDRIAGALETGL